MPVYQDRDTGHVFTDADLGCQYQTYVDELCEEFPEVQPCSYAHWLRGELQDRLWPYPRAELGDRGAAEDGSGHVEALPEGSALDSDEQGSCADPPAPEKCR